MIKNNEKGFALILSLVLLLVMSLMGGSLIVITAGDHRNNNTSDTYQQAFYVAETALFEGEKYIINQYLGPRTPPNPTREISNRNKPINEHDPGTTIDGDKTDCYNSFPGLPGDFKVAMHSIYLDDITNKYSATANRVFKFGTLLSSFFDSESGMDKEEAYLDRFVYEYFITKLGPAPFRGFGMSIKKGSSELGLDGIAYRIYGCGIYTQSPEIIIPLESTIVLPD